jgi:precorrin-2/cobalt-factor-2 C20-methyltransferase
MRRGKLIGVGVGPGDPELLTVKAVRALQEAAVVAFIAAAGRTSRAREIAASHLRQGVRELVAVMPMGGDAAATQRAYAQLATGIVGELGQGHNVAFLCEGDPLLYGSFVHLVETLGPRFECEVVPGITSLSAAAAAARRPLATREQALGILPATIPSPRLRKLVEAHDSVVLLKVGRHIGKVRETLAAARMLKDAVLIENVTHHGERIRPLETVDDEPVPYFALVLAHRERARGEERAAGLAKVPMVERRPIERRPPRERIPRPRRPPSE